MHMGKKMLLKKNTVIHTNMPRNCTVFLLPRRQTRSAIYGSQNFDSHKWPTVLVRTVKANLAISRQTCVDHCSLLLKHLSNLAFYTKWLQTLFIDQLVRSKATCSFKQFFCLSSSMKLAPKGFNLVSPFQSCKCCQQIFL